MAQEISTVKPTIKELYAILLKDQEPFVAEVIECNVPDSVIVFQSQDSEKTHSFALTEGLLQLDTNDILDIERVRLLDMDILDQDESQLKKLLTSEIIQDLDISLDEIKDKDMKYTSIELQEDLLSQLIYSYHAYDKYTLIKALTDVSSQLIELTKTKPRPYRYNLIPGKSLPSWIVPIIDNPSNTTSPVDVATGTNYIMNIKQLLESRRTIEPSLSDVGYTTNTHTGTYTLSNGSICRNTCDLYQLFDGESQLIHKADVINISGYMYLPSVPKFSLDIPNLRLSYLEKSMLFDIKTNQPYSVFSNLSLVSRSITDEFDRDYTDRLMSYSIPFRIEDEDVFYQSIYDVTPKLSDLLDTLPKSIQTKVVNYHDIELLYSVFELDVYRLAKDERVYVNQLVSKNITTHLKKIPELQTTVIQPIQRELSIEDKMFRALSLISNIDHIPTKNEYLQTYIQKFTRPARFSEDPLSLYNIYTNEPSLCKHYQYSSIYHKNRDAFETMMSIFGDVPQEGCIYCKHCGEYLCDEDFSQFEGFSDEQPILLREEIVQEVNLLESYKESDVLFVKLLGSLMGATLTDEDCQLVLDTSATIDADKLANLRYNTRNISTSDEHPLIKLNLKKAKKIKNKKDKQKFITEFTKDFQSYLKYTNRILLFASIVLLVIQTAIPVYTLKNRKEFMLMIFTSPLALETMTFNRKLIDDLIRRLKKYKDPKDKQWSYFQRLTQEQTEFTLPQIKDQIIAILTKLLSPAYPLIVSRTKHYIEFIQLSSYKYIRYEWPLYKPLLQSEIYSKVNQILKDKDSEFKPYYILNYNDYPVENVSLIQSMDKSQTSLHTQLRLKQSDLLTNQAFLRLFKLTVSNHGVHSSISHRIDLTIERLLQTLPDPEPIRLILKKYQWSSSIKSKSVMYHKLRTHIVPDIIQHYLRIKPEIETCYDNEKVCNEFVHTHINNYDLSMFRTEPKRHYQYIPFIVYPDKPYDELTDEFKQKLFHRYCLDPTGAIVKKQMTSDYLGCLLLHTKSEIESDDYKLLEKPLRLDSKQIKQIYTDIFVAMPMYPFEPTTPQTYKQSISTIRVSTESHYLDTLKKNNVIGETDTVTQLLSSYVDLKTPSSTRTIEDAVSKLYETHTSYLSSISRFMVSFEDRLVKRRFESIFEFTSSSINLSPEERSELNQTGYQHREHREVDIQNLWNVFINNDKLTPQQCREYISYFMSRLAELSTETTRGSDIPSYWKLSDNSMDKYSGYMNNNRRSSHRDLFVTNPSYPGYNRYKITELFDYLISYMKDNFDNLSYLRSHSQSSISYDSEKIIHNYLLYRFFYLLIETYDKLVSRDSELLDRFEKEPTELEEELQYFIMDLLMDMFEIHYDTRWTVSNINKEELKMRLSKQKEKEKQQLIQVLDTMSDEKRASTIELQKIGVISMYHRAMEMNEQRIIDEYSRIDEGDDTFADKDVVDGAVHVFDGEIAQDTTYVSQTVEDQGYYNTEDIDEDGQLGDELHEFHNEDLLDSEFNV